jgi:hypothetical protein
MSRQNRSKRHFFCFGNGFSVNLRRLMQTHCFKQGRRQASVNDHPSFDIELGKARLRQKCEETRFPATRRPRAMQRWTAGRLAIGRVTEIISVKYHLLAGGRNI